MLNNLTPKQIQNKLDFIKNYIAAGNARSSPTAPPSPSIRSFLKAQRHSVEPPAGLGTSKASVAPSSTSCIKSQVVLLVP